MVDQPDTADVIYAHVEARAGKERASSRENSALLSSQTSLSGHASSENSTMLPTQQPQKT